MLPRPDISILIIHQFPLKVHCAAKRWSVELGAKVIRYQRSSTARKWISEFTYQQKGLCRWSGPSLRKPAPPSGRRAAHTSECWAASAGDATPGPPPAAAALSAAELHAGKHHRNSGGDFAIQCRAHCRTNRWL